MTSIVAHILSRCHFWEWAPAVVISVRVASAVMSGLVGGTLFSFRCTLTCKRGLQYTHHRKRQGKIPPKALCRPRDNYCRKDSSLLLLLSPAMLDMLWPSSVAGGDTSPLVVVFRCRLRHRHVFVVDDVTTSSNSVVWLDKESKCLTITPYRRR